MRPLTLYELIIGKSKMKIGELSMNELFAPLLAIFSLLLAAPLAHADDGSDHRLAIVSITICNSDPTGAVTAGCGAAYDTERPVRR
jgi:hypothetical protein